MRRVSISAAVAGLGLVILSSCSAAHDAPFDLRPGQTGCQISVGDSLDTATAPNDMNPYGPLSGDGSEMRSASGDANELFWEAEMAMDPGTLTVRMHQPSLGEQTEYWAVADIPFEGVTMSGPWGGPYGGSDTEGDSYYFTCWTNPQG